MERSLLAFALNHNGGGAGDSNLDKNGFLQRLVSGVNRLD
jgi:hypothetical protein